jgi:hypothetical protein
VMPANYTGWEAARPGQLRADRGGGPGAGADRRGLMRRWRGARLPGRPGGLRLGGGAGHSRGCWPGCRGWPRGSAGRFRRTSPAGGPVAARGGDGGHRDAGHHRGGGAGAAAGAAGGAAGLAARLARPAGAACWTRCAGWTASSSR